MGRKAIANKIIKSLLANSHNQCAFKNCNHPIINDQDLLVAELAHIEAVSPNGPRHNPNKPIYDINSYENLLFLCHRHHKEVDYNIEKYTVSKLISIKKNHETQGLDTKFKYDFDKLFKINNEFKIFWDKVDKLNKEQHELDDIKIEINGHDTFFEVVEKMKSDIDWISKCELEINKGESKLFDDVLSFVEKYGPDINNLRNVSYYDNPFINRYWEPLTFGIPSFLNKLRVSLIQIELKYIEEFIKTNPEEENIIIKMEELKAKLSYETKNANVVD